MDTCTTMSHSSTMTHSAYRSIVQVLTRYLDTIWLWSGYGLDTRYSYTRVSISQGNSLWELIRGLNMVNISHSISTKHYVFSSYGNYISRVLYSQTYHFTRFSILNTFGTGRS